MCEKAYPLSQRELICLLELKIHVIKKVLAPRLCEVLEPHRRLGLLRLTRYMLAAEHNAIAKMQLDVTVLCQLARGIKVSLHSAISSSTVDSGLFEQVFHCAKTLLGIPATIVDCNAAGWLIDWCGNYESTTNASPEGARVYLGLCANVFIKFGEMVCDVSESGTQEELEAFRVELGKCQPKSWPPLVRDGVDLLDATSRLEERLGFTHLTPSNIRIANPYAVRKTNEIIAWAPSDEVRRAAKNFLNDLHRAS